MPIRRPHRAHLSLAANVPAENARVGNVLKKVVSPTAPSGPLSEHSRRGRRERSSGIDGIAEIADEVLIARILGGDGGSRERLYRKHVAYIAGMSARLLRSVDASEDIVQDTFVIAFQALRSLRAPAAFRGWLASIAVSQVRRRLARQRILRFVGLDEHTADAPLDELVREDTSAEVRSELAALDVVLLALPAAERIAWMLRYVEGESLDDVASACRCSLATVKRRILAADARVQAYVRVVSKEAAS